LRMAGAKTCAGTCRGRECMAGSARTCADDARCANGGGARRCKGISQPRGAAPAARKWIVPARPAWRGSQGNCAGAMLVWPCGLADAYLNRSTVLHIEHFVSAAVMVPRLPGASHPW
jgi:hypothetical protein